MKDTMKDGITPIEAEESDLEEIARLITDGCTSGILDREDGVRISWKLEIEAFEH